jgi:serine/threonine protein kinase
MSKNDLEIFSVVKVDQGDGFERKFGNLYGELVLVTENYIRTQIEGDELIANLNRFYKILEYDGFLEFRGLFVEDTGNIMYKLTNIILYPEGGTLSDLIFSNANMGWIFKINIAIDIAKSISCLHNANILHCDLQSSKLGFNSEWKCKVMELTSSNEVSDIFSLEHLSVIGVNSNDLKYAAPEVILNSTYSGASDIFSFGLVLYEICTRSSSIKLLRDPITKNFDSILDGNSDVVDVNNIRQVMKQLTNNTISDSLIELVRQMLQSSPYDRPTIEDVLDWLESLKQDIYNDTKNNNENILPMLPPLPFKTRRSSKVSFSLNANNNNNDNATLPSSRPQSAPRRQSSILVPVSESVVNEGEDNLSNQQSVIDPALSNIIVGSKDLHSDPVLAEYLQVKV